MYLLYGLQRKFLLILCKSTSQIPLFCSWFLCEHPWFCSVVHKWSNISVAEGVVTWCRSLFPVPNLIPPHTPAWRLVKYFWIFSVKVCMCWLPSPLFPPNCSITPYIFCRQSPFSFRVLMSQMLERCLDTRYHFSQTSPFAVMVESGFTFAWPSLH